MRELLKGGGVLFGYGSCRTGKRDVIYPEILNIL